MNRTLRRAMVAAAVLILALAAIAVIGGEMILYKTERDDAFVRCSVALSDPGYLILQKDGSYRSTAPSISLRWSWRRHDYLCVYHDDKGHEAVSPAPTSAESEPPSQPAWVTEAVTSIRRMFVGNPEPKSVRYHEGPKSASVTIRFGDSAVCGYCSRPAGAAAPRGRIATTSLEPRTHRALGFSLKG